MNCRGECLRAVARFNNDTSPVSPRPCAAGRLLTDPHDEVRAAACDALVAVAEGVIRPGDRGLRVLTLVLGLAHEEEDEDL